MYFDFCEPTQHDERWLDKNNDIKVWKNVSWFGFYLGVRESSPFTRNDLVTYLNERSIGTRLVFGGNLTKQPLFQTLPEGSYRISANLEYTDKIMNQAYFSVCILD